VIRRVLSKLVGSWCNAHERGFRSDFCPECLRLRIVRNEASDPRPEWTKAVVTGPIKSGGGEAA
jgi:hypothetical protein